MNFIIWPIVGGLIGWFASIVMNAHGHQGIFLNVVVGVIGALLGAWVISPPAGVGAMNQDNFSLLALFVSFVGAVILLAIVRFIRRPSAA